MKRVLMLSYHFPPDAAVGAIRTAKFAKFLPEFGWRPYVLTVKQKYYERLDRSRMSDTILPQHIFRTGIWPDPGDMYMSLKRLIYRLRGKRHILDEQAKTYSNADQVKPEGMSGRLRCFLRSLLMVADGKLGWVPPATLNTLPLMRRHKINCLYTTGPPHAAHVVGLAIKLLHGVRWVADFRDPWTLGLGRPPHLRSPLSDGVEAWMEEQVVNHADRIISVTDRMTQVFRARYTQADKAKFLTIPNGYDPDDFAIRQRPAHHTKFRISYLGTLYYGRTPAQFFKAVRELIDEGKLPSNDVEIRFIGNCRYIDGKSVEQMVRQEGLLSVVQIMDPVSYEHALREMAGSDVLLLFAPNQPDQVPGKAFEYLASGADIIAVTSKGATADLIKSTGRGFVVEPDSLEEIKDALEACYHRYKQGCHRLQQDMLSKQYLSIYHRRSLARELACILE